MKNSIKIFVLALLSALLIAIGFLAGCSTNTTEQVTTSDKTLIVIEDHAISGYYIVYDKDTKIMYYRGVSTGACLDPLYNTDGTLKLYNGGN